MTYTRPSRLRSRRDVLFASALLVLVGSGCSFEPLEANFDLDAAPDDMSVEKDSNQGSDLGAPDMSTPKEDMAPPIEDMPFQDMMMPADMMPPDQDMPEEMDMPVDMNIPGLGLPCMEDAECLTGRCEFFAGEGICTADCVDVCPGDDDLVCFAGSCTPTDFCSSVGTGPGCNNCDKCDPMANCIELAGDAGTEFSCVCQEGYEGDGLNCADIDECRREADNNCSQNAACANTDGGFTCTCDPGYEGDGVRCDPVQDPCAACASEAVCIEVNNQKTCRCSPGYTGNGFVCQDVDECQANMDDCSTNGTCTNTDGSFTCSCKDGFEGDGVTCQDIDECLTGSNNCDPTATCTNTVGGFTCTCPSGSVGNGTSCSLYASCAEIKQNDPSSQDGDYTIATPNGDLQVHCDMTSDGGVGYTMVRLDEPNTLGASQQAYKDLCATYGMEVITPRSKEHMDHMIAWNMGTPNLVNVRPTTNFAQGIDNWEGSCNGQPCSFYINGRDNVECRTLTGTLAADNPGRWSNGTHATSCAEYLSVAHTGAASGYYEVDVDGPGALMPRLMLCDMTLDGGGWTLGATSSDDGQGFWTWNNRALFTTDFQGFGNPVFDHRDLKDPAVMHLMPFQDLMFLHSPSNIWAAYGGVGDNTTSISTFMTAAPAPYCEDVAGHTMTAGTLTKTGDLCNTDLYFHLGDYDGSRNECENYNTGLIPRDESTFGPAWSTDSGQGCPFDDPAYASFGPNHYQPNTEVDSAGFGEAIGANTGTNDIGANHIQLYVRGDVLELPDGDNETGDLLTLTSDFSGDAGPLCPYGSWDDVGDAVVEQGWVICGIN